MKDQNCKEQAEVDSCIVLVSQIEGVEYQETNDEGHLNDEQEEGSIENVHLVVLFELELFFVLSHESAVANSVHVGSQFHIFRVSLDQMRGGSHGRGNLKVFFS